MLNNINSAEEYANLLVSTLREAPSDEMPIDLLNYWCDNVYELAINSYNSYLLGKRESFMLYTDEIEDAYQKAGLKYTEDLLNGMLDKGVIEALINEAGEIVYGLTEKGKKYKL